MISLYFLLPVLLSLVAMSELLFFACTFIFSSDHYVLYSTLRSNSFCTQGFDALLASLDVRGIRESHLHMMLQRIEMSFKESVRRNKLRRQVTGNTEAVKMAIEHGCCASMCNTDSDVLETSTSFVIQLGRNDFDNRDSLRRYQDFEKWMLKEGLDSSALCALRDGKRRCSQSLGMCDNCHGIYLSEEMPSPSCCRTLRTCKSNLSSSCHVAQCEGKVKITSDFVFSASPSSPLRMRLLKVLLSIVEVTTYTSFVQYILLITFDVAMFEY